MSNLIRKQIIDKNGKQTTVRVRPDEAEKMDARLPKPTGITKGYELNDVNKLIRQSLKEAFPGTKFSVTKYGSAAQIRYEDGPPEREVSAVVEGYIGSVRDYNFDTSYLIKHRDEEGNDVYYYSEYVFTRRTSSPEAMHKAKQILARELGTTIEKLNPNAEVDTPYDMYVGSRATNEYGESIHRPLNGLAFVSDILEYICESEANK